jgi:hypothetical protein
MAKLKATLPKVGKIRQEKAPKSKHTPKHARKAPKAKDPLRGMGIPKY